ncbi:12513_t:CDS:2 [Rhizophagus irregularis]|nr:12513_t:CDS:2 [Rhizophagus irregularis]
MWSTQYKILLLSKKFFNLLPNSIILTLASLSLNQGEHDVKEDTEFFTQLSDTLDAIKKLPRFYGKVKYKTSNVTKVITSLRVTEGWAYIDYENPLIPL